MTLTDENPDLLEQLDHMARTSLTVPGEIREVTLAAIQSVSDRDGDWGFGRVRALLPEWAHGAASGATVTGLVRSGAAVWTGRYEPLGNHAQRAGGRDVRVYRLTRRVAA
jgi:hypothetical protein